MLKPRSVEADSGDSAFAGSSSIFGGAKPVDTTKVLEEVERKIDAELHREPIKVPTPKENEDAPRSKCTTNRSRWRTLTCFRSCPSRTTSDEDDGNETTRYETKLQSTELYSTVHLL